MPRKTRSRRQTGSGPKTQERMRKAGEWLKNAGKYIKDKQLISAGLKGAAQFAGPIGGPIAGFLSGVAHQAGYGLGLPGQGGNGLLLAGERAPRKRAVIMPHETVGSGLQFKGAGINLPGQHNIYDGCGMHGSGMYGSGNGRIYTPEGLHEERGNNKAHFTGNRFYA